MHLSLWGITRRKGLRSWERIGLKKGSTVVITQMLWSAHDGSKTTLPEAEKGRNLSGQLATLAEAHACTFSTPDAVSLLGTISSQPILRVMHSAAAVDATCLIWTKAVHKLNTAAKRAKSWFFDNGKFPAAKEAPTFLAYRECANILSSQDNAFQISCFVLARQHSVVLEGFLAKLLFLLGM